MRQIIINKLTYLAALAAVLFPLKAGAETVQTVKKIALYGEAEYADDFKNFAYVNPQAPKGGRIVIPDYGGFDSFNPFIFKGIAPVQAVGLTLDTLAVSPVNDHSVAYPLIAKEFELPKDKSFIGFILDERAHFNNGKPILAEDVIFSFNALVEKGQPLYKMYYADVEKVEEVNNRHVRFYFRKGSNNRELPLILSQINVFSKDDFAEKDFSKSGLKPMLGSGPYQIKDFQAGKFVVLERVKNYWAKDLPTRKGFFNFDEIRFDFYQDTTVTLQALFSGNIDVREEYIAKNWITGYDNVKVKNGSVIKENIQHNNPAILQAFAFNTRHPKFADRKVRQAIGLAFNFDWANDRLFYNQYQRLFSYFTNTGMEATGLPAGKELAILSKYKNSLSPEIFSKEFKNPQHPNFMASRENLRQAVKLLNESGYDFVNGKMTNLKTGNPLKFEVLSNSANGSAFTRVMLPFIGNLKKIGIDAEFRNLEINIFKNRLDNFDFDMAIVSFGVSPMPGNEQREMWGSKSAAAKGSYNVAGVQNPVVDRLIEGLIQAKNKEDYEAYVRALDRVLLSENYLIFQWYSPYNRVAYQNKFEHPQTDLKAGYQPFTWWMKDSDAGDLK